MSRRRASHRFLDDAYEDDPYCEAVEDPSALHGYYGDDALGAPEGERGALKATPAALH